MIVFLIVWVGERVKRLWRRVFPVVEEPKRWTGDNPGPEEFARKASEKTQERCPHKFWDGDRCCGCGIERDGVKAAIIQRGRKR